MIPSPQEVALYMDLSVQEATQDDKDKMYQLAKDTYNDHFYTKEKVTNLALFIAAMTGILIGCLDVSSQETPDAPAN